MKTTLNNTEIFLENALCKGIIDSLDVLDNGYKVSKGDKFVNVVVGIDSALIREGATLVEVNSARLDNVLHHFILNALTGGKGGRYFVASSFEGKTVFTDPYGERWILSDCSPEAAKLYFMQFVNNSAEDALIASSKLVPFKGKVGSDFSPTGDVDNEVDLMASDCNPDDYAVGPSASLTNSIGKTVVGSFVVSSADIQTIEDFDLAVTRIYGAKAPVRSGFGLGKGGNAREELKKVLSSSERVSVKLTDSNKLAMTLSKDGIFSARFEVTPNVSVIEKAMRNAGCVFSDIYDNMILDAGDPVVSSIVNSALDVRAIDEKPTLKRGVSRVSGANVSQRLRKYGIDDSMGVFGEMAVVEI